MAQTQAIRERARPALAQFDVAVIGAGISGIIAAEELSKHGKRVLLVEADDIGGRPRFMDLGGVPVAIGALYLHGGDTNALTARAKELGFELVRSGGRRAYHSAAGGFLSPEQNQALESAYVKVEHALSEAGRSRPDASTREVIEDALRGSERWIIDAAILQQGQMIDAEEASRVAAVTDAEFTEAPGADYVMAEGVPTFIRALGESIVAKSGGRICLERYSAAVRIQQVDDGVRVDLGEVFSEKKDPLRLGKSRGTLRTLTVPKVIIAVPPAVLASGKIIMDLPKDKVDAVNAISMGAQNQIYLRIAGRPFSSLEEGHQTISFFGKDGNVMEFVVLPTNPLADETTLVAFTGGDNARRFETLGMTAETDYAVANLKEMLDELGHPLKLLAEPKATRFAREEYLQGAYETRKTGAAAAAQHLWDSIGKRIYFAGGTGDLNRSWERSVAVVKEMAADDPAWACAEAQGPMSSSGRYADSLNAYVEDLETAGKAG